MSGHPQAYTPIVGAGKHASVLHYVHNDAVIGENDLILVDAGGELDMYSSDITRCFPANGACGLLDRDREKKTGEERWVVSQARNTVQKRGGPRHARTEG